MADALSNNLEVKARCADLDAARRAAESLEIHSRSVQLQTDTYFRVTQGRLKLREIEGSRAELIWYDRPDDATARTSRYQLVPIEDADGLRTALERAIGKRGQVKKRREILLWENVRIHLDEVEGLGTFLELEVVVTSDDQGQAAPGQTEHLCEVLAIAADDRIGESYADLLGL